MDVTYNYLTVFNIVNYDTIVFVNDPEFGFSVVGVSSKATVRQTVINSINHEKLDTLVEWVAQCFTESPQISSKRDSPLTFADSFYLRSSQVSEEQVKVAIEAACWSRRQRA